MNPTEIQGLYSKLDRSVLQRVSLGWLTGGTLASIAAVLAMAGLAGARPETLGAVSDILIALCLITEGGTFATRFQGLVSNERPDGRGLEWGAVITAETLGGVPGIVIGGLVLTGYAPASWLGFPVVVYGATFLFTSMVSYQSGLQEVIGAIAFVLGLVAAGGVHTLPLALTAYLGLGLMGLLSGWVTGGRLSLAAQKAQPIAGS